MWKNRWRGDHVSTYTTEFSWKPFLGMGFRQRFPSDKIRISCSVIRVPIHTRRTYNFYLHFVFQMRKWHKRDYLITTFKCGNYKYKLVSRHDWCRAVQNHLSWYVHSQSLCQRTWWCRVSVRWMADSFSTNFMLRKLGALPCSQEGVAGPILSQFSFRARQCAQLWHFVTCYLWC